MTKRKGLSKEEKKRQAAEKGKRILVHALEREIRYGNLTRRRHEKSWKNLVSKIRLERLRTDLEYASQIFEWALDVKDCTISARMDELDEANDQYLLSLRSHNDRIALLFHQFRDALNKLEENFSKAVENMEQYYHNQNKEHNEKYDEQQKRLKTVLHKMQCQQTHTLRDMEALHFCNVQSMSYKAREQENKENLIAYNMKTMWVRYNEKLDKHLKYQERIKRRSLKNRLMFQSSESEIRKNLKKISYLFELAKKLKGKLLFLYDTDGVKLKHLTDTYDQFTRVLFILKNKVFKDTQVDAGQNKLLVLRSSDSLEYLTKKLKKGELLLSLMAINSKYETMREKVLKYPLSAYSLKRDDASKRNLLLQGSMKAEDKLILFYQRMAVADASRVALMEEKKSLEMEMILMRKQIQYNCGCLECPSKRIEQEKVKPHVIQLARIEKTDWSVFYGAPKGEDSFIRDEVAILRDELDRLM